MKPTTRTRILDHFRKHQTASVRELSWLLNMTGANVRHHLAVLESYDLIEILGQRREGRGRPLQVYGLSQRLQPDGLDKLAGTLLDIWLRGIDEEGRDAGLKLVAEHLTDIMDIKVPVVKRLIQTIEQLNELHYQARWEASAGGPLLNLGHCPYVAIVADHPELCRMDAYLLETRLGSPVEQTAKLQLNDKGLPYCAFRMTGS